MAKFILGSKWLCERSKNNGSPDFYFVIIDRGDRDHNKLCRIELVNPNIPHPERYGHGSEQIYSHLHIMKYGKLVE